MEPLTARYPFLEAAREAVEDADADLEAVVRGEPRVVRRARDRVVSAVEEGSVGEEHRSVRVELLSYPVARVLVSLVGEPALVRRYTRAEAATAHERFTADFGAAVELRSVSRERLSPEALLEEFDLGDDASLDGEGGRISVARYLALSSGLADDRFRLTNRGLSDGTVPVTRAELYELLREAVRARVESGLPLSVPEGIRGALSGTVEELREHVERIDLSVEIDAVVPELFPPCVKALLDRAGGDGPLPDHSRYALSAFLVAAGMDAEEIVDRYGDHPEVSEEVTRYQVDHLGGEGPTAYPPPSCATMQAYGDCVDRDEVCATIDHPLRYYEKRLDADR